ncbi:MAG: peroxiredoxin-like family protein [Aestuariibacter sp.]
MKKLLLTIMMTLLANLSLAADINDIAASAEDVSPLLNGETIPENMLFTPQGKPVKLSDIVSKKPTVLVFYRGGWCPYCSRQLAELRNAEEKIIELGYQIVAISPDSPQRLQEQALSSEFDVTLLSDSNLDTIADFGLGFFLDDRTAMRYQDKLGVQFVALDGTSKVALPVPAVYVVDTDGLIHFQYVNPNYKVRVSPELLYQATKVLNLK